MFILFECFAVWKPIICLLIFDAAVMLFAFLIKHKICELSKFSMIEKREVVLLLFLFFIIEPFIYITAEDIGTVSDQGAYFSHTMVLMNETEKEIHTLDEIGKISFNVDEGVRSLQNSMAIFYHYDGEDYYYPHALRTWCSYTALFGKMFGLWNCMKAVNYLYIMAIINMFYICCKVASSKWGAYLSLGLLALSPLMLYIGKAGLTEVALLYLVFGALFYLLKGNTFDYILAGLFIGLIGFVHISIYVYMPIITICLFLLSSSNKKAIYTNSIQLILFMLSLIYDYKISPIYTENQYAFLLLGEKMSYPLLFTVICLVTGAIVLYQLSFLKCKNNYILKIREFILKHYKIFVLAVILLIVFRTIYFSYYLCFTNKFGIPEGDSAGSWDLRSKYVNSGWTALSYLNIVNIARATGIIGLLLFLAIPLFKKEISNVTKVFSLCGLYALTIFTVVKMDTPFNYYGSRYFIPFLLPFITLTLVSAIKKRIWCVYVILIASVYNAHFWFAFYQGGPQVGQYEVLQDTLDTISSGSIVFLNPDSSFLNTRLASNLRILNENEVYNLVNFDEVAEFYPEKDKYIISHAALNQENTELLLSDIYLSQYSFGNGDNGTYDTGVGTYTIPIYIYKAIE